MTTLGAEWQCDRDRARINVDELRADLTQQRGYLHVGVITAIVDSAFAAMPALIPLSLGLTEGLLIAADLVRVVIGGLFSATLLTLVVVPVVYSLFDGLKIRFGRGAASLSVAAAIPGRARALSGERDD